MSAWNDDPLFDRLRALPTPEPGPDLTDRVRREALATLQESGPRRAHPLIAAAVAAGVVAYFGWAIAFVLTPRP